MCIMFTCFVCNEVCRVIKKSPRRVKVPCFTTRERERESIVSSFHRPETASPNSRFVLTEGGANPHACAGVYFVCMAQQ